MNTWFPLIVIHFPLVVPEALDFLPLEERFWRREFLLCCMVRPFFLILSVEFSHGLLYFIGSFVFLFYLPFFIFFLSFLVILCAYFERFFNLFRFSSLISLAMRLPISLFHLSIFSSPEDWPIVILPCNS